MITGRAEKPVYLNIEDDHIAFNSAADLWGKGISASSSVLHERHRGCQTLVIGPAGENLVRFANVRTHHTDCLGRGGGGAVMGSKNLKAIVLKGTRGVKYL